MDNSSEFNKKYGERLKSIIRDNYVEENYDPEKRTSHLINLLQDSYNDFCELKSKRLSNTTLYNMVTRISRISTLSLTEDQNTSQKNKKDLAELLESQWIPKLWDISGLRKNIDEILLDFNSMYKEEVEFQKKFKNHLREGGNLRTFGELYPQYIGDAFEIAVSRAFNFPSAHCINPEGFLRWSILGGVSEELFYYDQRDCLFNLEIDYTMLTNEKKYEPILEVYFNKKNLEKMYKYRSWGNSSSLKDMKQLSEILDDFKKDK